MVHMLFGAAFIVYNLHDPINIRSKPLHYRLITSEFEVEYKPSVGGFHSHQSQQVNKRAEK